MKIKVEDIIECLEFTSNNTQYFYNMITGKFVFWCDDFPDDKLVEDLEENEENYICLPDQYHIHEYSIMEEFIESLPGGYVQDELAYAIRGKGAFRRFKDMVDRLRLADSWYDYREKKLRKIALEWAEKNQMEVE